LAGRGGSKNTIIPEKKSIARWGKQGGSLLRKRLRKKRGSHFKEGRELENGTGRVRKKSMTRKANK